MWITYLVSINMSNNFKCIFIITFSESLGESAPNEKVDEESNCAENCQANSEIKMELPIEINCNEISEGLNDDVIKSLEIIDETSLSSG